MLSCHTGNLAGHIPSCYLSVHCCLASTVLSCFWFLAPDLGYSSDPALLFSRPRLRTTIRTSPILTTAKNHDDPPLSNPDHG
ncbi:hypothetical protein FKM82_023224 [Ascaphus truei]